MFYNLYSKHTKVDYKMAKSYSLCIYIHTYIYIYISIPSSSWNDRIIAFWKSCKMMLFTCLKPAEVASFSATDKGLISKIYKQLMQLNIRKQTNQSKNEQKT